MSHGPESNDEPDAPAAAPERRRYNRRRTETEAVPPYFAAFERMAIALEDIARMLHERPITLPEPRVQPRG